MESANSQKGTTPNADDPASPNEGDLRRKTVCLVVVASLFVALGSIVFLCNWFWFSRTAEEANATADVPARRAVRGERISVSINARQKPVELKPVPGLGDTVTEEQLEKALSAALPLWHPPTVPSLIHELRLWGQKCEFTEEMVGEAWSGGMIVETLLSDELCRERTTPIGDDYIIDSPFGVHVVQNGSNDAVGLRGQGHYAQLVAVLGETGVPASTAVTTVSGRIGTITDLLQDAILRYTPAEEQEFIGVALALWLPPETGWMDQWGNGYTFDALLKQLLDTPLGKGVCGGCHVPYAVTVIVRVDEQYTVLSRGMRKRALDWLEALSRVLENSERDSGGWDKSWPDTKEIERLSGEEVLDRITITGHHLEWIALAPSRVRPHKGAVSRAVASFVRDLDDIPTLPGGKRVFKVLLPCSHGARALCLLRDRSPYETWRRHWDAGRVSRSAS
jgi:hypothetical protein